MNSGLYCKAAQDNSLECYGIAPDDWLEEGRREERVRMHRCERERLRLALSSLGCPIASLVSERFSCLGDGVESDSGEMVAISENNEDE